MNYFFVTVVALIAGVANSQSFVGLPSQPTFGGHLDDHHPFGSTVGHFDAHNPTTIGNGQIGSNPFIQQLVLIKLLEDSVTKFQTAFNNAAPGDAEKVMQTYASFFLMIGRLLPEGQYGGYYPYSYSVQKLSVLSGGNPYIERLILKKILEDTLAKYQTDIKAKVADAVAQKEECKAYMNRILLIGKIFGL